MDRRDVSARRLRCGLAAGVSALVPALTGAGLATGAARAQQTPPFGLRLEDGVALDVDEAPPLAALRFSTCLPAGCLVPVSLDAEAVAALHGAGVLSIAGAAADSGREVAFSVSLGGFSSALDRIVQLDTP